MLIKIIQRQERYCNSRRPLKTLLSCWAVHPIANSRWLLVHLLFLSFCLITYHEKMVIIYMLFSEVLCPKGFRADFHNVKIWKVGISTFLKAVGKSS